MARKPVIQSAKADADLKAAAAYFQEESTALALKLLEQVATACEQAEHIDVLRILHAHRDIPANLAP